VRCAEQLSLTAVPGVPEVRPGDDLPGLFAAALAHAGLELRGGDVLVVSSKVVSKAEGRFVELSGVDPGPEAVARAAETGHDPRLVELVLRESVAVSRQAPGVLVVRHRLGFVGANAGIDRSNAQSVEGERALLLPLDPDASAARIASLHPGIGVVISDSLGRPFRLGTVGVAIGVARLPAVDDHGGRRDRDGRALEHTVTALADQVAAAADLVAGQGDEGRPLVHVRGLSFEPAATSARALVRAPEQDLYA